jgi:hypothetical protein
VYSREDGMFQKCKPETVLGILILLVLQLRLIETVAPQSRRPPQNMDLVGIMITRTIWCKDMCNPKTEPEE